MAASPRLDVGASVRPRELGALTSIRFFAALAVVFFHIGFTPVSKISPSAGLMVNSGYVAVGLFYVLSGFVLAYNYSGLKIDRRAFYAARFARLYPVYFLALVLALPIFLWRVSAGSEYSPVRLATSLALVPPMLQAWIPQTALAWNAPAWSISVECFFYLLFPWIINWIGRRSVRSCVSIAGAMWIVAIVPSFVYVMANHGGLRLTGIHEESWIQAETWGWLGVVNFSPLLRLPEFVAGVALGCSFKRDRQARSNLFYAIAAALSLLIILLALRWLPEYVPYPIMHNGALLPLWCVLIYCMAAYQAGGGNTRLLAHPLLILLGEASYGIYILQQPVSGYLKLLLIKVAGISIKGDYPSLALLLLYCVILCGASVLSFKWLEIPLRLRLRRRLEGQVRDGRMERTGRSEVHRWKSGFG